ncbi:unnamed protein product, partial [Discosporangium mesarthrocarpum]
MEITRGGLGVVDYGDRGGSVESSKDDSFPDIREGNRRWIRGSDGLGRGSDGEGWPVPQLWVAPLDLFEHAGQRLREEGDMHWLNSVEGKHCSLASTYSDIADGRALAEAVEAIEGRPSPSERAILGAGTGTGTGKGSGSGSESGLSLGEPLIRSVLDILRRGKGRGRMPPRFYQVDFAKRVSVASPSACSDLLSTLKEISQENSREGMGGRGGGAGGGTVGRGAGRRGRGGRCRDEACPPAPPSPPPPPCPSCPLAQGWGEARAGWGRSSCSNCDNRQESFRRNFPQSRSPRDGG